MGRKGITARELIDLLIDPGSFVSWDEPVRQPDPSEKYAAELAKAQERSGSDESIITGEALIRGRRVALLLSEYDFLAGSIGRAAAGRIVGGIERATREGLPLLAGPASGGTRMQEGTPAFVGMIPIAAAMAAHKDAGLPYLVYLRHPTTGGVMASWGSLGHMTLAEPEALLGFLGPRVYEAIYQEPFPAGVQVSENLHERGLIDGVVPPELLPSVVDRALTMLTRAKDIESGGNESDATAGESSAEPPHTDAWDSIERTRAPGRPGVRELLAIGADDFLPLSGTGTGERDKGLVLALASIGGAGCIVLGQERHHQRAVNFGPAALRQAQRGMRISAELGLPLVTIIDTPGASLSKEAEEGGMAGMIARCLADLARLPSPTVSALIGEGTGGGALALVPADRVLCATNGWLSPLPPEGASAIVHRDTTHAPEMARAQGVSSSDMLAAGVVDEIIEEHPDAAEEPEEFCRRAADQIGAALRALVAQPAEARREARHARYRALVLPGE